MKLLEKRYILVKTNRPYYFFIVNSETDRSFTELPLKDDRRIRRFSVWSNSIEEAEILHNRFSKVFNCYGYQEYIGYGGLKLSREKVRVNDIVETRLLTKVFTVSVCTWTSEVEEFNRILENLRKEGFRTLYWTDRHRYIIK